MMKLVVIGIGLVLDKYRKYKAYLMEEDGE
jgi:hypothetical protein